MRLRYYGHYSRLTGYGRAARDYLAALAGTGQVELEIVDLGSATGEYEPRSPEPRYRHLDELVDVGACRGGDLLPRIGGPPPPDVAIYHVPPRALALVEWPEPKTTKRVALTTWETARMPDEYARPLFEKYDQIIVPSKFCKDAICGARYCFTERALERETLWAKVRVVPHCFDPDFWQPAARTPNPEGRTRFYTIGAWGERKNPLGVLKAYLRAFTAEDKTTLCMILDGADWSSLRTTLACSGIPRTMLPEISIPQDPRLDEERLLELHQGGDCFVSATRGEGWGLGMFEAACVGNAVIAPKPGGQADFLDHYYRAYQVPAHLTPCFGSEVRGALVPDGQGGMMQQSTVAIPPGVTCRQDWYEPDLGRIAEMMVVHHCVLGDNHKRADWEAMDDMANRRAQSRAAFEAKFGYDTVGPQLLQEISR